MDASTHTHTDTHTCAGLSLANATPPRCISATSQRPARASTSFPHPQFTSRARHALAQMPCTDALAECAMHRLFLPCQGMSYALNVPALSGNELCTECPCLVRE
eukprot:1160763-Pelagomonas_calceolata.AAC.6